ncbi:MAG: ribonuclease P protein component [Bacteroidota bacterium]|jgi:ribonuclease P protein component|nr:MAG: ribonuclease P protein component [Bacteroidota bacterium]
MGPFSFRKSERLYKRKEIQELFEKGSSFHLYPFRVVVLRQEPPGRNHKVLISVPNRVFRKAVDRNLLKRRIREAYRLQKHKLPEGPLLLGFVYTGSKLLSFAEISQKMALAFGRIDKVLKAKRTADGTGP